MRDRLIWASEINEACDWESLVPLGLELDDLSRDWYFYGKTTLFIYTRQREPPATNRMS